MQAWDRDAKRLRQWEQCFLGRERMGGRGLLVIKVLVCWWLGT